MQNQEITKNKLKHKEWRRIAKKYRRKKIRQRLAKERDKQFEDDAKEKLKNPTYQNWLKEQEILELFRLQTEEHQHQIEEENWMRRELLAQKKFHEDKRRREEINAINEAQRLKIQKDFEELQKAAQMKRDKRRQQAEEIVQQHKLLLNKIQDYINGNTKLPSELLENANSNPGKDICQFFVKTAACRFGDKCEKNHSRPGLSKIILIRNFFTHIQLEQSRNTEYGSDINLEFSETDLYNDYANFYNDVITEMKGFGKIINFKVSSNCMAHLRGNVYVEFERNRDALRAYLKLQGRYYAGKQLNVEFCSLISWRTAICGVSFSKKCLKGRSCNFLHVFKNPGNKYNNNNSNLNNVIDKQNVENTISSWDKIDGETSNERHNWRWSESPEKLDEKSNKIQNKSDYSKRSSRHSESPHSSSRSTRKTSRSRESDRHSRHSDRSIRRTINSERSSRSYQKLFRREKSSSYDSSHESRMKKGKKKHKHRSKSRKKTK